MTETREHNIALLTNTKMLKKEKATPELAQLTTEVGTLLWKTVSLRSLAVKQKQTNHMNPQRPLVMASTTTITFLTCGGREGGRERERERGREGGGREGEERE